MSRLSHIVIIPAFAVLAFAVGSPLAAAADPADGSRRCGLHATDALTLEAKASQRALYTNCNSEHSERIWVTQTVGENRFFCVPANAEMDVGWWLTVHKAYHDSWDCA